MDSDTTSMTDQSPRGVAVRTLESKRPGLRQSLALALPLTHRSPLRWLALLGILIVGNLANALSWRFALPIDSGVFSIMLALGLYVAPGWSEWRRSRIVAPNWRPHWKPTLLALGAGLALALPSVIFFVIASGHGGLGYGAIPSLSVPSLLLRELIEIPLLTAFVEEMVFRQFLWRLFARKSLLASIIINAGIFTAWHLVVNARTLMASHLSSSPLMDAGAYLGSLVTIFAAGIVFAWVRSRTGSFVYPAIAHWALLAIMTLAAWIL